MNKDAIAYTLITAHRGPTKKQKCSLRLISIGYLCQYIPSRKSSPFAYKQNSREKDGYLTIEVMRLAAGTIPAMKMALMG